MCVLACVRTCVRVCEQHGVALDVMYVQYIQSINIHRPPKVFGQSCLPMVILYVQCFGIHISSLYGPIILIFSSI